MRYKKFNLIALLLLGFGLMGLQAQKTETYTDSRDGKVYKTVQIGNQVWMAENLAYKPSSGNYWAYDDDTANVAVYGYLYDWETAKRVCPSGWHLPGNPEWNQLYDYLGGGGNQGGKLKETGTTHWYSPNTGATNESGFSALPGGGGGYSGKFDNLGYFGGWWSATEYAANYAGTWGVSYKTSYVYPASTGRQNGLSVRCVKD